jgi:DNA-binding NtrC family response regulator
VRVSRGLPGARRGVVNSAAEYRAPTVNTVPSLRVLVVDDESLIRWSLSETLGDDGHVVAEAGDGNSAVRALTDSAEPFDVVLLDYHLPDSNTLALLSTIRRIAPDTVVIMMTAFSTPEMSAAALCTGAYRVVAKPFEVHDMASLVLEAHASRRH